MTSDTLPINWHPEWPGQCTCVYNGTHTESLYIMATVDDDTHEIVEYDSWAKCSWCGKDWMLKLPPKESYSD
jgi:hypothetical protein